MGKNVQYSPAVEPKKQCNCKSTKTILCVVAHPDDEVLSAGATIKKLTNQGHKVFIFWLGDGLDSRGVIAPEVRERHLKAKYLAADILGATIIENPNPLPDQRFDEAGMLTIVKQIEKVIKECQPDTIFTHSDKDLNLDHRLVNRAVITATRPGYTTVQSIYAFEVSSSTEWNFGKSFAPNYFVDVSETLKDKIEAMKCYDGELRDPPHPRSLEGIYALATYRGGQCGKMAAESFEIVRQVN